MKLKAIIVEDEFNAREEMEYLLSETGEVEVVKKCANAIEGIKAVNSLRPDVMFLDIQLPIIDGFEMLSMLEDSVIPHVVFVTAYDEFALKAFENDAVDYLLKPVSTERLKKSISKIKKTLNGKSELSYEIPTLKRIPSIGNQKVKLVNISEIEFIQSDETGVFFLCNERKKCFTELTLKAIETRTDFYRCHKQFLINLEKIDEVIFEENSMAKIQTVSGRQIPVSRRYLRELKEKLGF